VGQKEARRGFPWEARMSNLLQVLGIGFAISIGAWSAQ
jgi:hypothetical protein